MKRQDSAGSEETPGPQHSSMSSTSTSTVSSVFSGSEEQLEDQPTGMNMTDLDIVEETRAFLEENKQRLENIRFNTVIDLSKIKNYIFSSNCRSFIKGFYKMMFVIISHSEINNSSILNIIYTS